MITGNKPSYQSRVAGFKKLNNSLLVTAFGFKSMKQHDVLRLEPDLERPLQTSAFHQMWSF